MDRIKKGKKILHRTIIATLCIALLGGIAVMGINGYVKQTTAHQILSPEAAAELMDIDCILVLGCYVHSNGRPSDMLADRLRRGIDLYQSGAAPKLLMSGDHGQKDYNEVKAMKRKAMEAGIPSEDVFMDHAGFSTYESIFRARDVFDADRIIIVTQGYHLYRALYVANALGVEAYGVAADYHTYVGQANREVREVLARNKDFATSILQPNPTYLGEVIPVHGDGNLTNDEDIEVLLS
ncbi:MAG: YdcF family protein [Oscillospiraceae bacterium]|nr:YdcF family protein [Oscillospiraceae bacterium]